MFDLFTARSSLLPYVFVWAPYICMGKMLRISNNFSSEASGPMLLKFHVKPPYRINPPIRRFVYKMGAVFGPFPGRILLLLNYKTG